MVNSSLKLYDCAVIGGGIAGLCLAIQLAQKGHEVIVFEKNAYPYHKVCGEYVSNESSAFLQRLGMKLQDWALPQINTLGISSEKGFMLNASLKPGGFGISRYILDQELCRLARQIGVTVLEKCKVTDVGKGMIYTSQGNFEARIIAGAFGKINPVFAKDPEKARLEDNFIGVKYHIRTQFPPNRIELHNFKEGYCGISPIEDGKYCLCYLSHSENLKDNGNSIKEMEENVLKKNPFLKSIFNNSDFLFKNPVTVSNIKFTPRKTMDDNLIYLGDAAGCISPLTGNGMSMAAYTSWILSDLLDKYFMGALDEWQLRMQYDAEWKSYFVKRIRNGKQLQYLFGKKHLSDLALRILNPLGPLKARIIESTHGKTF